MTDDAARHIPPMCPNCERAVGVDTGITPNGECSWCGASLVYIRESALRELVSDLREKESDLRGANERIEGYEYARQKLEAVIEDD